MWRPIGAQSLVKQSDNYRWPSMLLAASFLIGMVLYAYCKASEIRNMAYRIEDHQVTTNGSLVLATSINTFTVKWEGGRPKTFFLDTVPPFQPGDVVAFRLDLSSQPAVLEEHHIRESRSVWYTKLLFSVVALGFVLMYFFRDFRFSREKWMFLQRS